MENSEETTKLAALLGGFQISGIQNDMKIYKYVV